MKREIVKLNHITNARLVEAMLDGTMSCQELAEHTGLHYVTVLQFTRAMYRAGACHIHAWEKDGRGRDVIKIYKIGRGKDAKRQKLTAAERQATVRAKRAMQDLIRVTAGAFEVAA